MSKREYLRKLLAEDAGADEIADLFGLTTESSEPTWARRNSPDSRYHR